MSDRQHSAVEDLSGLPAAERAKRYRELAAMHLKLGGGAMVEQARAAHLELAALWTRLARQAELQAEGAEIALSSVGEVAGASRPNA